MSKSKENDTFQNYISEWISITDEIINLEKQLKELRDKQLLISKKCVDQTNNMTDETIIIDNEKNKKQSNKTPGKNVPVKRKRRTKAEIEKEKLEKEKLEKEKLEKLKKKKIKDDKNDEEELFSPSDTDLDSIESLSSDTENSSSDNSSSESSSSSDDED